MNDNSPAKTMSEIQMLDGDERLTVFCSHQADADLVELAARLLRANSSLAYIEMQDLGGGRILARRGDHSEGKFSL
jgi:xanthine dehydrogenase molybdopterin-binding subunit B